MSTTNSLLLSALLCAALQACVLAPRGLDAERQRLDESGRAFSAPFEERTLPELPPEPTWRDLLQRAFLANGEIEARWQEWRAAVARVERDSTWPDTKLQLGFEYMFSSENLKAWDRTTLSAGFDPMTTLSLPSKVATRGELALDEARAAGERFRGAKFALQRRFLETWIALASNERELALREQVLALVRLSASSASRSAVAGGNERELLRGQLGVVQEEDAIARLRAQRAQLEQELLAMVGPIGIAIPTVDALPGPRPMSLTDAELFALAAQSNTELLALAHEVEGRRDALALARAEWLPDFEPFAGLTGNVSQFLGASITLPTTVPAIRAGIEAARADLDRSQALARQQHTDVRAQLTAALVALREAERATRLFEEQVAPLARRLAQSTRGAYAGGAAPQRDWLDALRMELETETALQAARAARETSLARIEELVGVDFETLSAAPEVDRG